MDEPMTAESVCTKRKKYVTNSMDDADGEYNCVSAKRRKPTMGKSRGTNDDSGWNISNISSYLTTTTMKINSILTTTTTNTSSVYYDVKDDDRHFQNEDAEKTLCDLDLQPNTDYGKTFYSDETSYTCCDFVVEIFAQLGATYPLSSHIKKTTLGNR